jgi:hypothetical protein
MNNSSQKQGTPPLCFSFSFASGAAHQPANASALHCPLFAVCCPLFTDHCRVPPTPLFKFAVFHKIFACFSRPRFDNPSPFAHIRPLHAKRLPGRRVPREATAWTASPTRSDRLDGESHAKRPPGRRVPREATAWTASPTRSDRPDGCPGPC